MSRAHRSFCSITISRFYYLYTKLQYSQALIRDKNNLKQHFHGHVELRTVRSSTLARLAMVLVLLSVGNAPALRVMFQTGGKPSTCFPSVGLVELYESKESFSKSKKFKNSKISKFSRQNLEKSPPVKKWSQIDISFTLSLSDHTQPKWNFNTWRILLQLHIFISCWFSPLKTCSNRPKLQKNSVDWGRVFPLHQYYFKPTVNRQPGFRRWDS